jgi:hypothetical protein
VELSEYLSELYVEGYWTPEFHQELSSMQGPIISILLKVLTPIFRNSFYSFCWADNRHVNQLILTIINTVNRAQCQLLRHSR